MQIKKANFIKGVKGSNDIFEQDFLHLAFYGRSNVGKSSTINSILGRKNLVKTSSKPGKTKELNFFNINDDFFIVDLPGYGYAKLSQKEREKIRKMILWYLFDAKVKNRINVLVLDIKVGLTDYDVELLKIFNEIDERVIVLLNKTDKLNQKKISSQIKNIQKYFTKDVEIVAFSALKKKGVEKFWQVFEENTLKKV